MFVLSLQGTIVDMLEDVNTGIGWVLQKISHYGGDPEQVYLVGQSCGGQLCSLTALLQVLLMLSTHHALYTILVTFHAYIQTLHL